MSGIWQSTTNSQHDIPASPHKWFAVYTTTRHEKRVGDQLIAKQVESFLPLYKSSRQWSKRTPVVVELPVFPNYIFVRIMRTQRTAVLETPGVISIIGSDRNSCELPNLEIEALRNGIRDRRVEPHEYLTVGARARVKSGILAGLEGVVIRKKGSLKIVLTIDQIRRSFSIEVPASEVEPLCGSKRQMVSQIQYERCHYESHARSVIPLVSGHATHGASFLDDHN